MQLIGALVLGAVAEFAGVRMALLLVAGAGALTVLLVQLGLYRRSAEPRSR